MAAFHNRFFIPGVGEFFNALFDLLRQSEANDIDGDTAEFCMRRLEEYQRTIGLMYSRLREYRLYSPEVTEQLVEDMGTLLNIIGLRVERLEPL